MVETVVTSSTSSNDDSDDDGSPDNFRKRKSATLSSCICTTFTLVQMEAISLKMKKLYKRIECVERNSDGPIKTMLGQLRKETTGKKNKATSTCAASTHTPRFLRTTAIEPLKSFYPRNSIPTAFQLLVNNKHSVLIYSLQLNLSHNICEQVWKCLKHTFQQEENRIIKKVLDHEDTK